MATDNGFEVTGYGGTFRATGMAVVFVVMIGVVCGFVYWGFSTIQDEHKLMRQSFEDLVETNRDLFLVLAQPNEVKRDIPINPVIQERAKRIIKRKTEEIVEDKAE